MQLPGGPRPVPGERLPTDFLDRLAAALAAGSTASVLVVDDAALLHGELVEGLYRLVARAGDRQRLVLTASADPLALLAPFRAPSALASNR
jgi:hypothetical protein